MEYHNQPGSRVLAIDLGSAVDLDFNLDLERITKGECLFLANSKKKNQQKNDRSASVGQEIKLILTLLM